MKPHDELRHLTEGPRAGERPVALGLAEVAINTDALDATAVLERCREVLGAVDRQTLTAWPDELMAWHALLPAWFVDACAPEESAEEAEQWLAWWRSLDDQDRTQAAADRPWSVSDWIHWMHPDERSWFWWDAASESVNSATITIEVTDWPTATGALTWLLNVSGAGSITMRDELHR